jgi:hypothetical protein
MNDELILNPTSYLLLISVCYGLGYFSKYIIDKGIDYLNKYYYIKD